MRNLTFSILNQYLPESRNLFEYITFHGERYSGLQVYKEFNRSSWFIGSDFIAMAMLKDPQLKPEESLLVIFDENSLPDTEVSFRSLREQLYRGLEDRRDEVQYATGTVREWLEQHGIERYTNRVIVHQKVEVSLDLLEADRRQASLKSILDQSTLPWAEVAGFTQAATTPEQAQDQRSRMVRAYDVSCWWPYWRAEPVLRNQLWLNGQAVPS